MFLSHSAAVVSLTDTLSGLFSMCTLRTQGYLRHVVCTCPRRSIFDIVVPRHVLRSHRHLIAFRSRQQECSCKSCLVRLVYNSFYQVMSYLLLLH